MSRSTTKQAQIIGEFSGRSSEALVRFKVVRPRSRVRWWCVRGPPVLSCLSSTILCGALATGVHDDCSGRYFGEGHDMAVAPPVCCGSLLTSTNVWSGFGRLAMGCVRDMKTTTSWWSWSARNMKTRVDQPCMATTRLCRTLSWTTTSTGGVLQAVDLWWFSADSELSLQPYRCLNPTGWC